MSNGSPHPVDHLTDSALSVPDPCRRRTAFLCRHTRRQSLQLLPEIALHIGDDFIELWRLIREELGIPDPLPPYWAFAWPGGQALARYLLDHPAEVQGRSVIDLGTGSGVCAIAAASAGAMCVSAPDVDPLARAAAALNAKLNGVWIEVLKDDVLDQEPPRVDVVLGGDMWYEEHLAVQTMNWLKAAHGRGTRVLMGDPGRQHFHSTGICALASYSVPDVGRIEDADLKVARVLSFC